MSWLGGIGFTMSLFIAGLAFPSSPALLDSAKVGILAASIFAGFTGWILLRRPPPARAAVFYDPRALDMDNPSGVLHAKAVVTDDESVFVTSANLTEAALDRNIELGILLRDRALALSISSYLGGLIERGLLRPLPLA